MNYALTIAFKIQAVHESRAAFLATFFGFDAGAAALAGFHVFIAKLVAEVELHEAAFRLVAVGRIYATGEHIALVLLGIEHYASSAFASIVFSGNLPGPSQRMLAMPCCCWEVRSTSVASHAICVV